MKDATLSLDDSLASSPGQLSEICHDGITVGFSLGCFWVQLHVKMTPKRRLSNLHVRGLLYM